jgi:hypothetical protein
LLTFARDNLIKDDGVMKDVDVIWGHDVITHVKTIMGIDVIIVPPHDFAHPSRQSGSSLVRFSFEDAGNKRNRFVRTEAV